MTDTLTLNCRNTADAQQQQHYHRINALARALHNDQRPTYLTAQQPAPHHSAAPNLAGWEYAYSLEQRQAELEARHWRLRRAINTGSVADIEAAGRRIDELEQNIQTVKAALEQVDVGRGRPCHTPNLYRITTDPTQTLIAGQVFEVSVGRAWILDTHALPDALHARLTAYLHSGTDAMPYVYRAPRGRYETRHRVPDGTRALLASLFALAVPEAPQPRVVNLPPLTI